MSYAYIKTVPNYIELSLLHQNGRDRIKVSLDTKRTEVTISTYDTEQIRDIILVPVEDIDWLMQVLDDIKSYVKLQNDPE